MACDIRIASEQAQFGSFELRRGMHPADGGIVRLVNTCGVGIALEMELTGEPISAQCALAANMLSKVVHHDAMMSAAEDMAARILRNDRRAVQRHYHRVPRGAARKRHAIRRFGAKPRSA